MDEVTIASGSERKTIEMVHSPALGSRLVLAGRTWVVVGVAMLLKRKAA